MKGAGKWRKSLRCLWVTCLLAAWTAPADTGRPVPRRILVKPRAAAQAALLNDFHTQRGGRVHRRYPQIGGLEVIDIATPWNMEALLEQYRASGAVEYAEADAIVRGLYTPNDIRFLDGTLWNLHNIGQNGGAADGDVDAPEAWDIQRDASGVIVAVIDSGVRFTHQDLAANMWRNPGEIPGNRTDEDGSGYFNDIHGINAVRNTGDPRDDHGHGTHVAGIIGAVADNSVGIAGVAHRVQIMALKFMDAGLFGTISDAIECIDYARAKGAKIINTSWGDYADYTSMALSDALARARDAGIIVVAAAGNDGENNDAVQFHPANYELDNIIAVAATTRQDTLASWSHYGARTVDLGAPGVEIYSTWADSDSSYTTIGGTSMATPHVAGACALIWARFPSLTYREVIQRVLGSTDPLPSLRGRSVTGGRLNLARALMAGNSPPVLAPIANQTNVVGNTIRFTATATDPDSPATALRFSLGAGAPAGATIDPVTGVFNWTPTTFQAPTTNTIVVRVNDNGSPAREDSKSVTIVVYPMLRITNVRPAIANSVTLTWTTIPGRTYRVQFKDNLNAATWTNIGSAITANGSSASASYTSGPGGKRYFRVVQMN